MRKILLGLLVTSIFAGTAVGAFYLGKKSSDIDNANTEIADETPTKIPEPTPSRTVSPTSGLITGSLSYPSEGLPDDLEVCAVNTLTESQYCTNDKINSDKFTYGIGYNVEVPVGSYLVYSKTQYDTYKAYFSEFVTCGLEANCQSHEPIIVFVSAGQTVENIDPGDWYIPTTIIPTLTNTP